MKIDAEELIKELDFRSKITEEQFDNAFKNKAWTQLAGFDGIATGLFIAVTIVKKMMKEKENEVSRTV
jgi:hypothetical protein